MEELRNPLSASLVAACIVAGYMFVIKPKDQPPSNSYWAKPAALVSILVYLIVALGSGGTEDLMKGPF